MEKRSYDKELIRSRLRFPEVFGREDVELRRVSGGFQALCPFHGERTPSFMVYEDHGHCFGCGWHGDIFKFWQDARGVDFSTAVEQLAGLCDVYPSPEAAEWKRRKVKVYEGKKGSKERPIEKPLYPALRKLRTEEINKLGALRGLNPLALRFAAEEDKRVGFCEWPQWHQKRSNQWVIADDADGAWVVTDQERRVLQYRRLSGHPYKIKRGDSVSETKAWTKGSPKWPIGAAEIGDRSSVLLVEGGADMLAAYHFLYGFGMLDKVAVVAILGSSVRIAEDALPFFRSKRVRVIIDADPAKPGAKALKAGAPRCLEKPFAEDGMPIIPEGWKVPSIEAAKRWQGQLTEAGAAVETFSLYGLDTAANQRVGDLNDLAHCEADVISDADVADAFFCWDF